jgi:hypothetical protein
MEYIELRVWLAPFHLINNIHQLLITIGYTYLRLHRYTYEVIAGQSSLILLFQ